MTFSVPSPSSPSPFGFRRLNFMCFFSLPIFREEKETQTQTFESGYFPVGWGSSTCSGGGQKVRYVPRNQGNQTFLAGFPRDFPGISRRRPKSLRNKSLCSIFGPYIFRQVVGPKHCPRLLCCSFSPQGLQGPPNLALRQDLPPGLSMLSMLPFYPQT